MTRKGLVRRREVNTVMLQSLPFDRAIPVGVQLPPLVNIFRILLLLRLPLLRGSLDGLLLLSTLLLRLDVDVRLRFGLLGGCRTFLFERLVILRKVFIVGVTLDLGLTLRRRLLWSRGRRRAVWGMDGDGV